MNDTYTSLTAVIDDLAAVNGVHPLDIADLDEPLNKVIQTMLREGEVSVASIAELFELDQDEAEKVANALYDKGFLSAVDTDAKGAITYQVRVARKRGWSSGADIGNLLDGL